MIWVLFILLAALAVVSAVMMVMHKNPVYSAVLLIITFFAIAGLYYLLEAPFLSIVQVIVYAGAIMVLFLFVIMLLNLREEVLTPLHRPFQVVFGLLFSLVLAAQLFIFISSKPFISAESTTPALGNVEALGMVLFTKYIYPFEIASILLLVGIIGAITLGRKKMPNES